MYSPFGMKSNVEENLPVKNKQLSNLLYEAWISILHTFHMILPGMLSHGQYQQAND